MTPQLRVTMMTHTYITAIGTASPPTQVAQDEAAELMTKALELDEKSARKLRVLYRKAGIDYRYSVLNKSNPDHLNPFITTDQRMQLYATCP